MELWYHSSMKMRFNIKKKHWSRKDRSRIAKAVRYSAYRYGMQDLDLDIKLGGKNGKYYGFSDFDIDSGFKIWLYPSDMLLRTVFHEMTHIKQFYRGDLDMDKSTPRWKGKKYKQPYWLCPWEQEAHEMEEVLLKEFLDIQL